MAKAILIMDMPERCTKCPLALILPQKDGLALCLARQKNGQEEYNPKHEKSWRPDWCPLRELPKRKEEFELRECKGSVKGTWKVPLIENKGFNACLDEILN